MCLFRQKTVQGMPAVSPFQEKDTGLPEAKKTTDDDKVAEVKYGGKKANTNAAAQRTGTDALTINLNQTQPGSTTGGVNT